MSKRDRAETGALVFGGVPRANLMPPEVGLRRRDAVRRRTLVALCGLVLAATIGGVAASFLYAAAAEQRLADERRVTEQLIATQLEFAEVTQVRSEIQAISELRAQLGAVEVLWADVLTPYLAVLGESDSVRSITVRSDAPAEPQLGTAGPLRQPRVATITLVITSTEAPTPWAWISAWQRLETYADASIDSVNATDASVDTAITLNLNELALSNRFPAAEGQAPAGSSEEDQ